MGYPQFWLLPHRLQSEAGALPQVWGSLWFQRVTLDLGTEHRGRQGSLQPNVKPQPSDPQWLPDFRALGLRPSSVYRWGDRGLQPGGDV